MSPQKFLVKLALSANGPEVISGRSTPQVLSCSICMRRHAGQVMLLYRSLASAIMKPDQLLPVGRDSTRQSQETDNKTTVEASSAVCSFVQKN